MVVQVLLSYGVGLVSLSSVAVADVDCRAGETRKGLARLVVLRSSDGQVIRVLLRQAVVCATHMTMGTRLGGDLVASSALRLSCHSLSLSLCLPARQIPLLDTSLVSRRGVV